MVYIPISPELSLAFGTPIAVRALAAASAINPGLKRAILERRSKGEGNRISNVGGWQSLPDLLDWPEREVAILAGEVAGSIRQISSLAIDPETRNTPSPEYPARARLPDGIYGWANVNMPGDYNTLHVHPGSHWAAVYYVATGEIAQDTATNGRLELRDPRPAAVYARIPGFPCGQSLLIRPQTGQLIVFPAWIEHCVHPFQGEGERISIAINIGGKGARPGA